MLTVKLAAYLSLFTTEREIRKPRREVKFVSGGRKKGRDQDKSWDDFFKNPKITFPHYS